MCRLSDINLAVIERDCLANHYRAEQQSFKRHPAHLPLLHVFLLNLQLAAPGIAQSERYGEFLITYLVLDFNVIYMPHELNSAPICRRRKRISSLARLKYKLGA